MSNMKVQEYLRDDGSSPYQKWFDSLDATAAAKVTVATSRLELGNTSRIKWFDGIGEYRINWGPGYRIYLAQDGKQLIVLFGGGIKKGQQADIKKARELYQEYKDRKNDVDEQEKKESGRRKRKKR
ncbi:MAG: type II toxin-antitoxin system RelE/ParE family toxin [Leptolyngbyaceae cyanobacterium CSU_1_4]|nr:type II toxin-antitoxin system RelE/ParE family toxin [Leptolyngbyaceae cyanobacterium CSU_1_4]